MMTPHWRTIALITATGVALAVHTALAVDVRVEFDKKFDFTPVRTWAWNPKGPGDVKMARSSGDDAEAARRRAEPLIVDAVNTEMTRRGLMVATAEPDLTVTYFLLLTTNMTAQTLGQFLPATTAWGIPPFAPATQSLQVMNQGSLVLDLNAKETIVWRGVAQAQIKMDADDKRREALIRESVRDLLERYPARR
ncbi:MAG TPA: DUF4136 domain-containing protein [Vicinamibacterales bacterium]|jgi:hypothetical protein|nr:DUF4136 domain-containing protein [Vicinamibacterales bacterium]